VKQDGTLDNMGIVDNCTHLGCTFPWNELDQQFQCPCHGSRYSADGAVVRAPAPLPLKLVHVALKPPHAVHARGFTPRFQPFPGSPYY
jgi:cytochrome b6-f complex iron-sulfur subunit